MTTAGQQICVVDDDALVRKTVENILVEAGYAVSQIATGAGFISSLDGLGAADSPPYDCVLLDVKMPDMDGLEVLRQLASHERKSPIVMISGEGDISTAVEAMQNGAIDFVEKPFTPEQLVKAVARAVEMGASPAKNAPQLANLSSRELEVLELLVAGDANKVIAYKLGISQRTVEVHRARIMERLSVRTFAELVRKAIAAGM